MPGLVKNSYYQNMLKLIKDELASGLLKAQKALEYVRLKTYWQMAKGIIKSVKASKGELQLNSRLYNKISRDIEHDLGLQMSADLIYRTIRFYKDYPVFPENTPLTFTHYLALERVRDPKERLKIEQQAINKNLSAIEIKQRIAQITKDVSRENSCRELGMHRGEPYVYYLKPGVNISGGREMFLDCGFNILLPVYGEIIKGNVSRRIKQKRVVRVEKTKEGYNVIRHQNYKHELYTYAARVLKVVDGDTMDVHIDVGFSIWLKERVRLKGINTPEINTIEGKTAKDFVIKSLSRSPVIVIRTEKAGMYGRWLADVFILPRCDDPIRIALEGEFINQRLLDEGFAEIY